MAEASELPFSARYSLPAHVSAHLGEVSWEAVFQLSGDFQAKSEEKKGKVKKIVKELQMSRLLLMERIKEGSADGRVDPRLLVDVVRLLQRCEEVMELYEIDLRDFSTFLYMLSEKLKKEKLALHIGHAAHASIPFPLGEELSLLKSRSERPQKKANGRKKKGK